MRQITIPGGFATVRDASEVKVKDRREFERAAIAASDLVKRFPDDWNEMKDEEKEKFVREMDPPLSPGDMERMDRMNDAAMLSVLENWTLTIPVPKTTADLEELPGGVYDALQQGTAQEVLDLTQRGSYAPHPDQSRPTGPSSASN